MKGATCKNHSKRLQFLYFNPRSREGSDDLSICFLVMTSNFNPRSREGSDCVQPVSSWDYLIFQSTLPWRERQNCRFFSLSVVTFQSTLPWRERPRKWQNYISAFWFQSTLPWRERLISPICSAIKANFNPRSREGSDSFAEIISFWLLNFNPRSREGSDLGIRWCVRRNTNFNPRSREGSDTSFWMRSAC